VADISVPAFWTGLRQLLLVRAPLAGVPVYLIDRGSWTDAEAVVLPQVSMTGARWLGWGTGYGTVEPLVLAGYLFVAVAGNDPTSDKAALDRAGVLLGEVVQQLRDDPTVGGALVSPVRLEPPKVDSALWDTWRTEQQGAAIIRVRVSFRIIWQAVS
jgi:hypothetical protein